MIWEIWRIIGISINFNVYFLKDIEFKKEIIKKNSYIYEKHLSLLLNIYNLTLYLGQVLILYYMYVTIWRPSLSSIFYTNIAIFFSFDIYVYFLQFGKQNVCHCWGFQRRSAISTFLVHVQPLPLEVHTSLVTRTVEEE